jgi:hypothetical protein
MTTNEIPHESILFVFIQKNSILIECKDKMQALQHEWKLTHKHNIREKKTLINSTFQEFALKEDMKFGLMGRAL